MPLKQRIQFTYLKRIGRFPNLHNPKTFTEKIQARKLFDQNPLFVTCADKVAVKDYVASEVGAKSIIIPSLFIGMRLPPLRERTWPIPFVIKAAHGSGMNIFVESNADLDWPAIENKLSSFLGTDYGDAYGEPFYTKIPRRFLVEPFVGDPGEFPEDYKLYVFRGRTEIIQVNSDRTSADHYCRTFYDPHWNRLEISIGYPSEPKPIRKPRTLDQMIGAAAILGKPFAFVRIDFYEVSGKLFFGEMTFTPNAGYLKFEPSEVERQLGAMWVD